MWYSAVGSIVTLLVSLLVVPLTVEAQQVTQVHRIGLLHPFSPLPPSESDARTEAFRQGLHDLGYVEGQNLVIRTVMRRGAKSVSTTTRPSWSGSRWT